MDDELDTFTAAQPNFQQPSSPVWTDQHHQVVEPKHSDRVCIRVENVLIGDAMLSGTVEDDRIHVINLS